jgi:hypothetical protein
MKVKGRTIEKRTFRIAVAAVAVAAVLVVAAYLFGASLVDAAGRGNIAPAAVPTVTLATSHYARLGSLTAAESASLDNIAPVGVSQAEQVTIDPSLVSEEIRAADAIESEHMWHYNPLIPDEIRAADGIQTP